MIWALSILIFVTIAVVVFAFGAATMAPSSVLGSRLREIGWQRAKAEEKPAIRERIQQADPPAAFPVSPTDVSERVADSSWYRDARHGVSTYLMSFRTLDLVPWSLRRLRFPSLLVGIPAFGFFLASCQRAMKRQRRIRLALPDASVTVIC
jgi:hypothetical protein